MADDKQTSSQAEVWDERRLRVASDAAGVALWSWNVDSDRIMMDKRAFELWGLPPSDEITFEELSDCIFPADRDMVREAFSATRDLTGAYETDFRIKQGDDVRWVSARGRGDDQGMISRIMYGVFLDVTVRKLAEEERDMVNSEMHHRVKNMFSLSSALAGIASRSTTSKEDMYEDLTRRLRGLAAAHDLIFHGPSEQHHAVTLKDLLNVLLQAYLMDTTGSHNVVISAPELLVGETTTTSIAMLIHELATNSAKYGAFSAETGRVVIDCQDDESDIKIVWIEGGGPILNASAPHTGFGSEMTERVIRQLNGSISRSWTAEGLIVTLTMKKDLLRG